MASPAVAEKEYKESYDNAARRQRIMAEYDAAVDDYIANLREVARMKQQKGDTLSRDEEDALKAQQFRDDAVATIKAQKTPLNNASRGEDPLWVLDKEGKPKMHEDAPEAFSHEAGERGEPLPLAFTYRANDRAAWTRGRVDGARTLENEIYSRRQTR